MVVVAIYCGFSEGVFRASSIVSSQTKMPESSCQVATTFVLFRRFELCGNLHQLRCLAFFTSSARCMSLGSIERCQIDCKGSHVCKSILDRKVWYLRSFSVLEFMITERLWFTLQEPPGSIWLAEERWFGCENCCWRSNCLALWVDRYVTVYRRRRWGFCWWWNSANFNCK